MSKWETAALNGEHDRGHVGAMTLFEADVQLMRAGAYVCACGSTATGLHRVQGRLVRSCKACREISRSRSLAARMSSR